MKRKTAHSEICMVSDSDPILLLHVGQYHIVTLMEYEANRMERDFTLLVILCNIILYFVDDFVSLKLEGWDWFKDFRSRATPQRAT